MLYILFFNVIFLCTVINNEVSIKHFFFEISVCDLKVIHSFCSYLDFLNFMVRVFKEAFSFENNVFMDTNLSLCWINLIFLHWVTYFLYDVIIRDCDG